MAFTNKTTNYGLPQYVGTDRPKILTDVNDAYAEIDKQMKANADAAAAASAAATVAQSAAENAATKADTSQTTADSVQEGLDSVRAIANNAVEVANVADHHADLVLEKVGQGDIDKVNSTGTVTGIIGNTSITGIGDGTVSGAINSLALGTTSSISTDNIPYTGGIAGTETSTLTGALEATSTQLSSTSGELVTVKNDIQTINNTLGSTDISSIGDGTVTGILASGGIGGMDWSFTSSTSLLDGSINHTGAAEEITFSVSSLKAHKAVGFYTQRDAMTSVPTFFTIPTLLSYVQGCYVYPMSYLLSGTGSAHTVPIHIGAYAEASGESVSEILLFTGYSSDDQTYHISRGASSNIHFYITVFILD